MNGSEFRSIRDRLTLTQAELAELLSVTPNTVARMERDEMPIRRRDELSVRFLVTPAGKQWAKAILKS